MSNKIPDFPQFQKNIYNGSLLARIEINIDWKDFEYAEKLLLTRVEKTKVIFSFYSFSDDKLRENVNRLKAHTLLNQVRQGKKWLICETPSFSINDLMFFLFLNDRFRAA